MDDSFLTKKRHVPVLTRQNWRDWFYRLRLYLAGEGLAFVIDKSLIEYAGLAEGFGSLGLGDKDKDKDATTASTARKPSYDKDRYAQYEAASAKVQYQISISIDSLDSDSIRTFSTAYEQWQHLWTKYNKTRPHENREDLAKLTTYTLPDGTSVEDGWTQIKELRRRVVTANPSMALAFEEKQLFNFLLAGLPAQFQITVDTLNAQPFLSIDEKLIILVQRQAAEKGQSPESADFTRERRPRSNSNSQFTGCHLCSGKHFMMKCPYLDFAKQKVQHEMSKGSHTRRTEDTKGHAKRPYNDKYRKSDDRRHTQRHDRSRRHDSKGYSAEAISDTSSSDSSCSDDDQLPSKSSTALPQDGDDDSFDDTAAISREAISKIPPSIWVSDTAATSHMTDDIHLFRGPLNPIRRRRIRVGGGELWSDKMGTVKMKIKGGNSALLHNVLFVPNLGVNLMSARKVCSNSSIQGSFDMNTMVFKLNGTTVIRADVQDGVYLVSRITKGFEESAFLSKNIPQLPLFQHALLVSASSGSKHEDKIRERYTLWHRRFCHIGGAKISKLHKVTTLTEKIAVPKDVKPCEVCKLAKMRNRMPKTLSPWKDSVLDLVSLDVCGPLPPTLRGSKYFCQIIDNASRYTWTLTGKDKKDIVSQLHTWKPTVEAQTGQRLLAARIDNAAELKEALQSWAATTGVKRELSAPYASHQNGTAERSIQTAENGARAMLKDAKLPIEFWDEAVEADTYLRNRTNSGPYSDGERFSPYEALFGHKPSIDHIRVFGCKCYSYVHPKSQPKGFRHDKLVDRGRVGIFMGYSEDTTKQYKVYAPDLGYTTRSAVVEFDENENASSVDLRLRGPQQGTTTNLPDRNAGRLPPTSFPQVELPSAHQLNNFSIVIPTAPDAPEVSSASAPNVPAPPTPMEEDTITPPATQEPTSRYQLRKRKADDDDEETTERQTKIMRAMMASAYITQEEVESAFLANPSIVGIPIPATYKQAINDTEHGQGWQAAIQEELVSLAQNGTWREEVPPPSANLVSSKWVFTIKTHADGTLERYKARLVARGFSQIYGEDYFETFAPTVRMDTLRIFFAMVATNDWECHHLDIKNAFTESILEERIYMSPPQGVPVASGHALRVLRSLYGLKQSARDWNLLCKSYMLSLGFRQSLADPCLFLHDKKSITLLIYVDDIAVAAPTVSQITWFHKKMLERFRTKDLGEIGKILSIRITRDRANKTIYLDQEQYLQLVLKRFGFQLLRQYSRRAVPLSGYDPVQPAKPSDSRADKTLYQQGIGSMMYAMVHTRPDIAFALGKLSQHMSDPADFHWKAFKGLLRYIACTLSTRLRYGPGSHQQLVLYSDADWAAQRSDRKSTSGTVSFLYGGPICWGSKVQRSVATSSTESEYIAMSATAKMSQWIAQVLRDMNQAHHIGANSTTISIKGDNKGAIALVQNPHLHERSKHIDICYHHIRDLYERKKIDVDYVPTENMPADGLTKPLMPVAFQRFILQLGLSDWSTPNSA